MTILRDLRKSMFFIKRLSSSIVLRPMLRSFARIGWHRAISANFDENN